jgi:alpha-glucosidase
LPWSSDQKNFGFTSVTPWLPQMASYADYAIDKEVADSHSSLAFYKKTLEIRKNHPALGGEGSVTFLASKSGVVAFSRVPGFVVVANTNDDRVVMEVEATSVLHQSGAGVGLAAGVLTLPAHTTVWLQR